MAKPGRRITMQDREITREEKEKAYEAQQLTTGRWNRKKRREKKSTKGTRGAFGKK